MQSTATLCCHSQWRCLCHRSFKWGFSVLQKVHIVWIQSQSSLLSIHYNTDLAIVLIVLAPKIFSNICQSSDHPRLHMTRPTGCSHLGFYSNNKEHWHWSLAAKGYCMLMPAEWHMLIRPQNFLSPLNPTPTLNQECSTCSNVVNCLSIRCRRS